MSFKTATILLLHLMFLSTTITLTVYNNARFNPIDKRYMIGTLLSTGSVNACLCECYNNIICFTANYNNVNQTCLLYFAQLNQGQLFVVPTIMNAQVYDFGNRSFPALKIFTRTNETIYAIWNTTAGGNSSVAVSGYSTGSYWPSQPPELAFDNYFSSVYTSYGNCNYTWALITCGQNTGLYLTPNGGPLLLVAFYFVTNNYKRARDPLTITIEGSNMNESALTFGSSWTLIYNGSAGLMNDPGRSNRGTIQMIPNSSIRFASYRLLVTSKSGNDTCTSYSEFVIIGY